MMHPIISVGFADYAGPLVIPENDDQQVGSPPSSIHQKILLCVRTNEISVLLIVETEFILRQ